MIQQPVLSLKIGVIEQEGVVIVLPTPELYDSMRVLAREQKKECPTSGKKSGAEQPRTRGSVNWLDLQG